MTALLRDALRSDIPAMQRVRAAVRENRLVSLVIEADDYQEAIEITGHGFVIEEHGELLGFAVGNRRTGNIWALFVAPEHERRGHGRRLFDALVAWLVAQGVPRLWLTTEPGTRAAGFYLRAGWSCTGLDARGELGFELRART